jgi:hypothetical protein
MEALSEETGVREGFMNGPVHPRWFRAVVVRALLALVGSALLGIPLEGAGAKDSDPDAEEGAESFSLIVKDLPPEMEKKTPSSEDGEKRRLARVLAMVKEDESLDEMDLGFLRRHREAAVSALRAELKGGWKKAGSALETLMSLGDVDARTQWFAEFKKGNVETRQELLGFLAHDESGRDLLSPRNPEEEDVFRAALEPKHFVLGAAFRINDRPGVVGRLIDELPQFPREDQWSVAGVITSGVWTSEEARRFLAWTREQASVVREKELAALQEVVADIMEKQGETLAEAEKLFLDLHARDPRELPRSQGMARAFCKGATAASSSVLDAIFKEAKDPVIRGYALEAITRLRGSEVLADLEPLAADPKRAFELWDTLTFLAESGAREKVNEFVQRHFPKLNERGVGYVLRYGSPDLLQRAEEQAAELRPHVRFALEWKLRNRTLPGFFQRLKERDLISRVPTAEEIAETAKGEESAGLESDRAMRLLAVLEAQMQFDSEADIVPPAYDRLLDRFAQFTRGAFAPRGLQQRAPKPASEDEEPQITVEFVIGNKQFTLKPQPLGDWYDVQAIQVAVNRALEVAGKTERLLAVESVGQEAAYVFGPPAAWQEIAREYSFPLALDASSAVRQGKDYEKRVIETLKEREDALQEK